MTLAIGTCLGPYEILAPIGAGGMGEVYRARDTKLGREVAVKVLPEALAQDATALARFEREARAVAALSHPHIMAIHDFGSENGVVYAVMELLDGVTLRERLAEGPLPPRKAIDYAVQMAQGLAAAHERGIVHRDLKPENLFVTRGGLVKILDFGLARQTAAVSSPGDTHSPTLVQDTDPGTVLGTVGYMSPEQVKGRSADARSDIFSFGAVLYEMLTGSRAFRKETAAETMTAILREDPPEFLALGAQLLPALERIVRHCLEKEPDERFRSAHDLAFALEAVAGSTSSGGTATTSASARPQRGLVAALALAAACLVVGAAATRLLRREPVPPALGIRPLTHSGADAGPAVSPDGRTLAFCSWRDGMPRIWLKQIATGEEVVLTSGPDFAPRFSPDGTQLLFLHGSPATFANPTDSDLYRVPMLGGTPRKVAAAAGDAEWTPDGRAIAFIRPTRKGNAFSTGVFLVLAEGGAPKELARYDGRELALPRFSPDGETIALTSNPSLGNSGARFELLSKDGLSRRSLEVPPSLGTVSGAVWDASGREIFYLQSTLVAYGASRLFRENIRSGLAVQILSLPFESNVIDALGAGTLVAQSRSWRENLLEVSLSADAPSTRWLAHGTSADRQPVFSPDGEWIAFSSNRSGNLDIWEISVKTGTLRRLTEDDADDWDPGFTRDGKLIWSSGRSGHLEIWMCDPDGSSPRRISEDGTDAENPTATPDGWIVYAASNSPKAGLWKMRTDGTGAVRFDPGLNLPEVSPDGRYVACVDRSAPNDISTTPRVPGSTRISVHRFADGVALPFSIPVHSYRTNGTQLGRARWSPDGKRIYFVGQDEKGVNGIYMQDFDPEKVDTSATRRKVTGFDPNFETESFAVSPDGTHLILAAVERLDGIVTIDGVPGVTRAQAKSRIQQ